MIGLLWEVDRYDLLFLQKFMADIMLWKGVKYLNFVFK